MVTRKPTPQSNLVPAPLSQAAHNPPYPLTPSSEELPPLPAEYTPDPSRSPAFTIKTPDPEEKTELNKTDDPESDYSSSEWERSDDEEEDEKPRPADLPDPLKIGGGKTIPSHSHKLPDSLPDVLKVRTPPGVVRKTSWENIEPQPTGTSAASWGATSNSSAGSGPSALKTNNPYLRMQSTGQNSFGGESSQQAWGDAPSQSAQNYGEIAELPSTNSPTSPTTTAPFAAAAAADAISNNMATMSLHDRDVSQTGIAPTGPTPIISVESPTPQQTPATATASPQGRPPIPQAWNSGMDASSIDAWAKGQGAPESNVGQPPQPEQLHKLDGLPTVVNPPVPMEDAARPASPQATYERPELIEDGGRPGPAVSPVVSTPAVTDTPPLESPTAARRKEHYPIKHIRWYDATAKQIRESPILTQNINGPCPLLALVNALVLSTPLGLKTEFIETFRTREQVSLGLLVDAVIEELMSGRRGTEVGDVAELYKFFIGLQTGMNVNPMFVPDPEATDGTNALLPQTSSQPGGFENTRDMRLYRIFNVPLLHGWLPEPGSEAYAAFDRIAKTYETSQLVQFQEEELDAKLQTQGLNEEEQRLFTDIHAIKEFLNLWPTQLTEYGLRNMQQAIKPGQVGILFRNDHFSTLYKNPHTNELMTLVTDQGYSTHDEIVWESLVDVSGRGSELYSGDFRAVGNTSVPQRLQEQEPFERPVDAGDGQGWTTVTHGRHQTQQSSSPQESAPVASGNAVSQDEQADHDYALALQLQEEEEDRHRRETEERVRRENALSEAATSSSAGSGNRRPRQSELPPLIPPRRNNAPTSRPNNDAVPPPTYEEAATSPQYIPPTGHPASPNAPFPPRPGGRRPFGVRPMGEIPPGLPPRPGRRHSSAAGPGGHDEREKCIVM